MMTFRNVEDEPFLALTDLNWTHQVNGEKTLSGTIYSHEAVLHDIDRGWKVEVEFEGEIYYITYALPTDYRGSVTVQFDAIHEFFYFFGKSVVYQTLNGSHTMRAYLDMVFSGSDYRYLLTVDVPAFEKENFGMRNRLALFNDIVNSANVEFEVIGKEIRIVEKLGSDLSTIVRKGFNMQELSLEHNIGRFVTHARGFGAFIDPEDESKGRLTAEYTSPLAEIYGVLEADPVVDERFTQYQSLLDRLKQLVDSSYSISVNLSLEDLQREGYPYALPRPGDYILAINEDLNFKQKIRIVGIEKSIDVKGDVIEHQVTCSSLSAVDEKNKADAINSQIWQDINSGVRPIPNEWLTSAVNEATQSLLAAQTELRFTNHGILAVDKTDANRVVLLSSTGIGISTDGGKSFENALTARGLNASAIYTGVLKAIDIEGSTFRTSGHGATTTIQDARIETVYSFSDNLGQQQGTATLEPNSLTFTPTRTDGIAVSNVQVMLRPEGLYRRQGNAIRFYGDCMFNDGINLNNQRIRNVMRMGILTTGVDGGIWFPGGSQGWKITEMNNNMGAQAGNLHIVNRGRKRITFVDDVSRMLLWRNQSDQDQTRQDAIAFDGNAILVHGGNNWSNFRIGVMSNGSLRVTTNTSNEVFRPVLASSFNVQSTRASKENIQKVDPRQALDLIQSLDIKSFHYKKPEKAQVSYLSRTYPPEDDRPSETQLGVILEECPTEIMSEDGEGVNTTKVLFNNVLATQELYQVIQTQEERIKKLEHQIMRLLERGVNE